MATNSTPPNINTGKLALQIDNVNDKTECHSSLTTEIGGFKWHLEMRKMTNNDVKRARYTLHMICLSDNDSNTATVEKLWMCKTLVNTAIKKANNVSGTEGALQSHFFNGHTCQQLVKIDSSIAFLVEVDLSVKSYNLGINLDTDLQMLFNDKEECVAVNKFALASFSTYFRNLFFGNWSERVGDDDEKKTKNSIEEEPNFDLNAFKMMLYSAMAMGGLVEEGGFLEWKASTALAILKLSIKYDVPTLQDYCQKYFLNFNKRILPNKMEVLEAAEQLGLQQLKDHCLNTFTPIDFINSLDHSIGIYARLKIPTQQLLASHLYESAKKAPPLPPTADIECEYFE